MPRKRQYQTRLDSDMADRVDQYAEEHDLTDAEAIRRLVARGLDHLDEETMTAEEMRDELDILRNDLYDTFETDETDSEADVARFRQAGAGSEAERIGGVAVAFLALLAASNALLGPTATIAVGLGGLAVASYLATTYAIRYLYTESDAA